MKRGIVLKIQGKMAIVLTPDGEFLRTPTGREGWWPGQEVTWPDREPRAYLRPALALACVLVLLLAGSGLAYRHWWALGPVVAYVSVDINPSLELGVDARERVCSAWAFNPDGERLLAGLTYRRRSLVKTLSDLTLRAVEQGYLGADRPGAVLVAVVPAGTTAGVDPARLREEAVTAARLVLQQRGLKVEVKGWTADRQVHEEARRHHISAGRMALYLAARRAGAEVTLEQVCREPIAQVLSLVTGRPDQREPGTTQEEREFTQGEGWHGKDDRSPAVPGNKPDSPGGQKTGSHGASPSGGKPGPGSGEEPAGAPGESTPTLESSPGTVSPPPPEQDTEEPPADEDESTPQATQPPPHPETQPDGDGQTAVCPEGTSQEQAEEPPHSMNDLLPPASGEEEGR
ncbi:MAG: anti-sigma factor domain-containing protein [Bacillota bacterium]